MFVIMTGTLLSLCLGQSSAIIAHLTAVGDGETSGVLGGLLLFLTKLSNGRCLKHELVLNLNTGCVDTI